jgi:hypothetical protein
MEKEKLYVIKGKNKVKKISGEDKEFGTMLKSFNKENPEVADNDVKFLLRRATGNLFMHERDFIPEFQQVYNV